MPHEFDIPRRLAAQGWRVKVFDKETVEPPHVAVILGTRRWRLGLRTGRFLDRVPPARDVPRELLAWLQMHRDELTAHWDRMYPHNPVQGGQE